MSNLLEGCLVDVRARARAINVLIAELRADIGTEAEDEFTHQMLAEALALR